MSFHQSPDAENQSLLFTFQVRETRLFVSYSSSCPLSRSMNNNTLVSFLLLPLLFTAVSSSAIGVTYTYPSLPASTPPPQPERVSATISALHVHSLRLPNPDPSLIRSFSYTNTSLFLSIPNALLPALASNKTLALRWLYGHVLPFYPRSRISLISVGDDAVSSFLSPFILPAVKNVRDGLDDLGIKKVSVSTTFSFVNLITTPFPPSSAAFQESLGLSVVKPLLEFLETTNSSFCVNLYPYNMYRINSEIPLGFALFEEHPFNFRDDLVTGVRYRNLFDMMVDAVLTALAVAGHENLPVVVAETGWPSSGADPVEVDATPIYAEMYLKGLIGHLRSGVGTPLRKEGVAEAYIFELADQDAKQQGRIRNWGILHANLSRKYNLEFSSGDVRNGVELVLVAATYLVVVSFLAF